MVVLWVGEKGGTLSSVFFELEHGVCVGTRVHQMRVEWNIVRRGWMVQGEVAE